MVHKPRHGVTLIDMLLTIALSSAVMGLAAGVLHTAFSMESQAREHLETQQQITRLTVQLRRDLLAAEQVEIAPEQLQCMVRQGRSIIYEHQPGEVLRVEQEGDRTRHRERFALPAEATVRWKSMESDAPTLVQMIIELPANDLVVGSATRPVRILAAVGLPGTASTSPQRESPPDEPDGEDER